MTKEEYSKIFDEQLLDAMKKYPDFFHMHDMEISEEKLFSLVKETLEEVKKKKNEK